MNEQATAKVVLSGPFDNMRAPHIRLLQEAAKGGPVHVFLWDDATIESITGAPPKFPEQERLYYVQAVRYVESVTIVGDLISADALPDSDTLTVAAWVVPEHDHTEAKQAYCQTCGIDYTVIPEQVLKANVNTDMGIAASGNKKVLVTGCYAWFHTGHIRFFEEVSELGDLYVVVGHDANILALKGEGHPLFDQEERRYIVGSIHYVTQALISTGQGWLDAAPEIERIKPDIYAVNEDGDKSVKQQYCQEHGIEYVVLKRLPKPGLTRRESTHLRGF